MQMIPDNLNIVTQIKKGKLAAPAWLEHLAGGAQVEVNCLSALDSVIKPENTAPCLKAVIDDMTGMSVSDPNLIISSVVYVTSLAVAYEAEQQVKPVVCLYLFHFAVQKPCALSTGQEQKEMIHCMQ